MQEAQNTMPSNPREAGRKGGASRSEAKLAAARRNGFQKTTAEEPAPERPHVIVVPAPSNRRPPKETTAERLHSIIAGDIKAEAGEPEPVRLPVDDLEAC
jgi:hypothetical protein